MEYGLGQENKKFYIMEHFNVLILLLMEYGLGHIVAIQIGGICHEPS